jgi:hypothetical protein
MQIFSPRANVVSRSVLIGGALLPFLAIGVTYGFMNSSYVTGQDVILGQPVPFSHKHHARELGIACLQCHTGVETSAFAGVPATHICMTCHSQIWTNAALLAPVRESLAHQQPIHWNRVNRLPGRVSRVISGLNLSPGAFKAALDDAGQGALSSLVEGIRLLCYGHSPLHGAYNETVRAALAAGGLITLAGLAGAAVLLVRRGGLQL